jgi:hypothetical protein
MTQVKSLTQFRAVHCSGAFIPDDSAVVALSLLFEKVHLPNNIELIRQFVQRYRITPSRARRESVTVESDDGGDLFSDLTTVQQETAKRYLALAMRFAHLHSELFGEVFESELFPNNKIVDVKLLKGEKHGEQNLYRLTFSNQAVIKGGDENYFPNLLAAGYVPVVGRFSNVSPFVNTPDEATAKQLAALLAMKSVEMVIPRTRAARPDLILEARDRLRDQLPPFWSSMFKASVELKKLIAGSKSHYEVSREATDLVDRTIRPAVIDLATKLEKERKDWFYKILSPVRTGLRLLIGNPPLSQQQMLTSALVLASDACASVAENMRTIEALKSEAGLSYLLDLADVLTEAQRKA